jgi:hypothetical protein
MLRKYELQGAPAILGLFYTYRKDNIAQLKNIRFCCSKQKLKTDILGMTLFIEIAVSCHHLLYPGPEQLAGPGQGVPLKDAHHLLHLVDQRV